MCNGVWGTAEGGSGILFQHPGSARIHSKTHSALMSCVSGFGLTLSPKPFTPLRANFMHSRQRALLVAVSLKVQSTQSESKAVVEGWVFDIKVCF